MLLNPFLEFLKGRTNKHGAEVREKESKPGVMKECAFSAGIIGFLGHLKLFLLVTDRKANAF